MPRVVIWEKGLKENTAWGIFLRCGRPRFYTRHPLQFPSTLSIICECRAWSKLLYVASPIQDNNNKMFGYIE